MPKRIPALLGAVMTAVFASTVVSYHVHAQGPGPDTHGLVPADKSPSDGKPVPIKVVTKTYDNKLMLANHMVPEDVQTGRIVWEQKCAFCHDGVGQPTYKTMGPWLGAETLTAFGEANIRTFILNGDARMPAFKYALDSKQVDDLIAFLKTIPSDQKPTADQLAGKRTGPESSD